jgi:capsular exopolysaccharide synthesis family protein
VNALTRFESDPAASTLPQDPIEVLRITWQRKLLLILSLGLCLGGGYAYWHYAPRIYESTAKVLVVKTLDGSVAPGDTGQRAKLTYLQDYMSAHETLMKSPLIVGRAIEKHGLAELKHIANHPKYRKNPTKAIVMNLKAARDFSGEYEDASAVLDLSYRSTDPNESRLVLQAILETYNEYLQENDQSGLKKMQALVSHWNDQIVTQLEQKKQEFVQLRNTTPELVAKGAGGFAVSSANLDQIAAQKLPHTIRRQQCELQLKALQSAKESGIDQRTLMEMVSRWYIADARPDSLHKLELMKAMVNEQTLVQQYGPGHPQVAAARERIKLIQEINTGSGSDGAPTKFTDPVESFIESLKRDLQVSAGIEDSLNKLLEEEHKKTRQANATSTDLDDLRLEIADLQLLQRSVIQQVRSLDFANQSGLYNSQVIATPENGVLVSPNAILTGAIAAVCGIVLGAVVILLAEIIDQSFRSADEVTRRIGLPVLGSVPHLKRLAKRKLNAQSRSVHPRIHAQHRPNSAEADAFRSIRIAMNTGLRNGDFKVVQVTSPQDGNGVSTFIANLAASLAHSGKRVLIVDADLRYPSQHWLFGLPNDVGLTSVLAGESSLEEALKMTDVPGLWVLPSGPEPGNSAEILDSAQFCQCLVSLRHHYDVVLVDTPGLLDVSDACIVAGSVDKVIVMLKNTGDSRRQAEESVQALMMADADLMGVIMSPHGKHGVFRGNGVVKHPASDYASFRRNGVSVETLRIANQEHRALPGANGERSSAVKR